MVAVASQPIKPLYLASFWGVLGFAAILAHAIYRLTPLVMEPFTAGTLLWWHWPLLTGWVAWMAWTEGYRAFHQKVSPRVVARALWLARNPKPWLVALAPLFCMALVHAPRKRMIVSWSVLSGIVALVLAVRMLPQPWRGIVDAGVVAGLGWGLVAMLVFFVQGLQGRAMPVPAEIPGEPN